MERSGNFYKAIQLGYILISILIGCMAYNSLYEWQEIEALELGNKKIDELRKEINNINIQMIKFSLLGETILEWNDKDIEHYHARRMAMDRMSQGQVNGIKNNAQFLGFKNDRGVIPLCYDFPCKFIKIK